jgi:peptidoglycan/xylan/chitin deacetylase (PgdA/CDA1 family)
MRPGLKRALEMMLARGGPAAGARALRRGGGVLVLAYHNVVPHHAPPTGERSLHLSFDQFRRELDLLERWTTVASLARLYGKPPDEPLVVLTFDDAYRGAVTLALGELRNRALPATMFVAPGRLGGRPFWWDALAGENGVPPAMREHALDKLRGIEAEVLAWAAENRVPRHDVPDEWCSARSDELTSAVYPGLTLASHSWSHANLARLSRDEIAHELDTSREWLAARFPDAFAPWLAYPYGRFSSDTQAVARASGFAGALRIDGGWTRLPLSEPFAAARLNVPRGLSDDGFALRVSGLIRA